jgi:hypothetical protein
MPEDAKQKIALGNLIRNKGIEQGKEEKAALKKAA